MKSIFRRQVRELAAIAKVFRIRKLRQLYLIACSFLIAGFAVIFAMPGETQTPSSASTSVCFQPSAGSVVNNPPEIRNADASNPARFTVEQNCYLANGNLLSPTLRVTPGKADFVLNLTNKLPGPAKEKQDQDCEREYSGGMAPKNSTNLHYHGLNVSPKCHQDEVVRTVVEPNENFEYKIEIPANEPPGLYWYHPHVHMQSEDQVLRGLTGAIVVEGIGTFNQRAAQLTERVFVLRDMPVDEKNTPQVDCTYIDPSKRDSNNDPYNPVCQPAKDISINSVPIRYHYTPGAKTATYDPPAVIKMKPNEEQFWRVANTAADTYFDLQLTYDGTPQQLTLVARDGIAVNSDKPKDQTQTIKINHIQLPPGGRAEFIITGPGASVKDAKFLTLNYDTGSQGDNDPQRTIARIDTQTQLTADELSASASVPESNVDLKQVSGDRFSGLSQANSVKERTLYFSEDADNFYITVEPNKPKVYDPNFKTPDITVQEGTIEDWTVENRTQEVHAFHIHQIHFLVEDSPDSSDKGMLRDTINVPVGKSVKLKMDFRGVGKSIAGTFVYHCHILEHEDKGMMAPIEVKPISS